MAHTLGRYCAFLHDSNADNDALCAHYTCLCTIMMQCALPWVLLFPAPAMHWMIDQTICITRVQWSPHLSDTSCTLFAYDVRAIRQCDGTSWIVCTSFANKEESCVRSSQGNSLWNRIRCSSSWCMGRLRLVLEFLWGGGFVFFKSEKALILPCSVCMPSMWTYPIPSKWIV